MTQSEIQQRAYGTLDRNEAIRKLAKEGRNYAEIARWFKLSRQAVRVIVIRNNPR